MVPAHFSKVMLAAAGAMVAYFAIGFLAFAASPLRDEFSRFPAVYRSQEGMQQVMPFGMIAMFVAMILLAVLYSQTYRPGYGLAEGARFGTLIGLFAVCAFVIHNYVNLNIGLKLTVGQSIAYLVEWIVVGAAIGLIYRPAGQ